MASLGSLGLDGCIAGSFPENISPCGARGGCSKQRIIISYGLFMVLKESGVALILFLAAPLCAQNRWFETSLIEKPEVHAALQSVDDRAAGIVDEWIRLVEIPAPSGKEQ